MKKIGGSLFLGLVAILLMGGLSVVPVRQVAATTDTTQISTVSAQEKQTPDIIVFVREGCQHCADEEDFLAELQKKDPSLKIEYYRLENPEQRQVWEQFTTRVQTAKVTPLTIVGNQLIIGFGKAETTGLEITEALQTAQSSKQATMLENITAETLNNSNLSTAETCPEDGSTPCLLHPQDQKMMITVPILGRIDANTYPLVALSIILGFLDGFNPCAMWVLVTFLVILTQVGSRQKMFTFAGIFILAEAIMYYLILTVWFKTWDFVKLDQIVTPIVGLLAIGGGLFFLYESRTKDMECKITDHDSRHKTRQKLKELANSPFTIMTFFGILGIAFSVNVIEFACSIGIPQTFTKILELNDLSFLQTHLMILIYILFYMVDDFIVFGLALYAIDKIALTAQYSKWSNLIGGIIMVVLGLILIFKPQFVMLSAG